MKNYSQNDEQSIILNYFKGFKGTFCDIGANDGVTLSNTYALHSLGWKGVLIEPSPAAYKRLENTYREHREQCYNLALGKQCGEVVLQESGSLISHDDVALVSSLIPEEVQRFKSITSWIPVKVQCVDWKTFMMDWSFLPHFDFISMDIEGCELEVLPQMDLSEVKMFCIEWNSKPELKREYDKYFNGFKIIHTTAENLIYAR
jgi:FkbM family methyltransferase